ncbi:hypothetical protein HG536_0G02630 [Torulaspora globosa]|uniref:C2H2-type domain-containing protein n=1 Tax=Torulaspora globosa TaxID=48254 RepID=A0A7G3ZLL6_9SACH|nr:uncharacterized protein HG536_0G02630 [Torulaspora globosa]QLL34402.1 hypothetical protein HG536_0G02630 [Torulaspora globosa]
MQKGSIMDTLESRRAQLEDLEIIEESISSRFERNPEIFYSYLENKASIDNEPLNQYTENASKANRIYKRNRLRRSRKQIVVQQNEINILLEESLKRLKSLSDLAGPVNTNSLEDDDATFETFRHNLDEIKARFNEEATPPRFQLRDKRSGYAMFSASTAKAHPTTILSRNAQDLNVNDVFDREEQYGEILSLERFHSRWFSVIRDTNCSLLEYYGTLELFLDDAKYLLYPPMDRKNERYTAYLIDLSSYLENFFKRANVLINHTLLDRKMQSAFSKYLSNALEHEQKGCYCVACCKWFKLRTVFDSHQSGKAHKKNLSKRSKGLLAEYKVHAYLVLLKRQFMRTKELTERKLAFTAEERMQEMSKLHQEYQASEYATDEQEQDDKTDDLKSGRDANKHAPTSGSFDLPLGPDGLPMPHWLYKLQGLDVTYSCEICANQTYKGRRTFEKHFLEPTHTFHLKCLGIEPSLAFKGITSIKEAQELWQKSAAHRQASPRREDTPQQAKIELEVEDQEGNVLSEKVYQELKKQGLV